MNNLPTVELRASNDIFRHSSAKYLVKIVHEYDYTVNPDASALALAFLVKILGTDRFYWDAQCIYIIDPDNARQQIRIGMYDGVRYGIGYTKDGGATWQSAIGFDGITLSTSMEQQVYGLVGLHMQIVSSMGGVLTSGIPSTTLTARIWNGNRDITDTLPAASFVWTRTNLFSGKIVCGCCGAFFGKKIWGSYRDDKTRRREVWQCNDKFKSAVKCKAPHVTEAQVQAAFLQAVNDLIGNRAGVIADCRLAMTALCDTAAIDREQAEVEQEMAQIADLSRKVLFDNARTTMNHTDWNAQQTALLARHRIMQAQLDELSTQKHHRQGKAKSIEVLIRELETRDALLETFDEPLFQAVVERVTVGEGGGIEVGFKGD